MTFTDRYQALGIPYPNPTTMCKGDCEGIGVYPLSLDDPDITPEERAAWDLKHEACGADCDGWHFIKCLSCGGTGKAG